MCGRFVRSKAPEAYGQLFGITEAPDLSPSYNVAPTQPVAVVRMVGDHKALAVMRWGLIPLWAKDKKTSFINARADTVLAKPAFRAAIKRRRCLIVADGYYEWQTEGKQKRPFYFHMRDDTPIAFAGIWDTWQGDNETGPIESCAIITTDANELTRFCHDRMPVILPPNDVDAWLDPGNQEPATLTDLLRPYAAEAMTRDAVVPLVNSVKNNGPACLDKVA